MARRRRKTPIIDIIRRQFPDEAWTHSSEMNEWVSDKGTKVYARCHISISEGGCESYHSRWYVEQGGKTELWRGHGDIRLEGLFLKRQKEA